MPIRNESSDIARSLGSVLRQDYDPMEVLVVDGASDDDTVAVVQDVAARSPHIPVTVLSNPKRIVPTGMNIALARAKGDVIVRVDGHCEIEPDYVRRCV